MQHSKAAVVAFLLLCALQLGSVLGNGAAPGCTSGECSGSGPDETVLIQTKIQAHQHKDHQAKFNSSRLPGLSNITGALTDAVKNVTDSATSAIVSGITTLAENVANELEQMKDQLASYVGEVNSTAMTVESGVATILSTASGIEFEGIAVGKEYEEQALNIVKMADTVWSTIVLSLQGISTIIDTGLATLPSSASLQQAVDSAMQVVLSSAGSMLESIGSIESTLMDLANVTIAKSKVAESQAKAGAHIAVLQAKKMDPLAALDALNTAVTKFTDEANAFANTTSDVAHQLLNEIPALVTVLFTDDQIAQVTAALEDVQTAANDLTSEVVDAATVLSGITDITAAAADALSAKSGSTGMLTFVRRGGLSIAAAALLAAVMV